MTQTIYLYDFRSGEEDLELRQAIFPDDAKKGTSRQRYCPRQALPNGAHFCFRLNFVDTLNEVVYLSSLIKESAILFFRSDREEAFSRVCQRISQFPEPLFVVALPPGDSSRACVVTIDRARAELPGKTVIDFAERRRAAIGGAWRATFESILDELAAQLVAVHPQRFPSLHLTMLGDGGVGLTAMVIQYVSKHFVDEYDPTIEDSYSKQVTIDGYSYLAEILDTAGQEEFCALRDQWIRDAQAFLLVYSITSRSSFDTLPTLIDQIKRVKEDPQVVGCIVGNKSDLSERREVSLQEGKALAEQHRVSFFETSAKTAENIDQVFFYCFQEIVRCSKSIKSPPPTPSAKKCIIS